jgi:hypothetical protein
MRARALPMTLPVTLLLVTPKAGAEARQTHQ